MVKDIIKSAGVAWQIGVSMDVRLSVDGCPVSTFSGVILVIA